MTRSIHADLVTEQKKMAYTPSLQLTFSDNNLPHPVVVDSNLTNYSGNPTASVLSGTVIVRAHRVAGVGIQVQLVTAPGTTAQWEAAWTTVEADGNYPALFMAGTRCVLCYQDAAGNLMYRYSDDNGTSWSAEAVVVATLGYTLNGTQYGISGTTDRGALIWGNTSTTLSIKVYNKTANTWGTTRTKVFAGTVWPSSAVHVSGDAYTLAVIVVDYATWTDCAIVMQPYTHDNTWGTATTYIGVQGGTGANPAYKFDYACLAKVGSYYWLTYRYVAATAYGALYTDSDHMIAVSDDGIYYTAGVRLGLDIADRLQPLVWTDGTVYLASDRQLWKSTPITPAVVSTADVMSLDIQDIGPTAYADLVLDNRAGTYTTLRTGRLGCDLTIERGAVCAGTARRVTRETFCASLFTRQANGSTLRVHAYNYHKLLSLWKADFPYYYAAITLQVLVQSIAALAGVHAATFDANGIWALTIGEFAIQPGQTAAEALASLQHQFQFVSRMSTGATLDSLVLADAPTAAYTYGTAAGEHRSLLLDDATYRDAPEITRAEVIGAAVGAAAIATALQSEMGRQFTHRTQHTHLTTAADCLTVANATVTKINNAVMRSQIFGLPAFHLQPYDAISSDDWTADTVRYVSGLRETYNPTRQEDLQRKQQVWRQTVTLASIISNAAGAGGVNTVVPDALKRSDVRKGKIVSFDSATWIAIVRVEDTAGAVPLYCGHWLSPAILTAGKSVAILMFDATNPADGLVIGPYSGTAPSIAAYASAPEVIAANTTITATYAYVVSRLTINAGITLTNDGDLVLIGAAALINNGNLVNNATAYLHA